MFENETSLVPLLKGREVTEIVSKINEGEEPTVEEALEALEDGAPDDQRERVSKVGNQILSPERCHVTPLYLRDTKDTA